MHVLWLPTGHNRPLQQKRRTIKLALANRESPREAVFGFRFCSFIRDIIIMEQLVHSKSILPKILDLQTNCQCNSYKRDICCYHRAKQTRSPTLLRKYQHLRNKVVATCMVKRGKRDYPDKLKSASCKFFLFLSQ